MADTYVNESFINIYDTVDDSEVKETVSRTDKVDTVDGNGRKELYEMQELDKSKQEVVNKRKSLKSSSKAKCAFRVILTVVVTAILIAVVFHWLFISFTSTTKKVGGAWSSWNDWGSCSVSCGYGMKTRNRTCTNPVQQGSEGHCHGRRLENTLCFPGSCTMDDAWSSWNDWGSCSVSCGNGMKTRNRTCTSRISQGSGGHCHGHSLENTLCFPGSCTNGSWSDWQNWSNCSVDCGVGFRTRSRTCSNPQPSQLGTNCQGKSIDIGSCNKKDCDACQSHPCHYGNCRSNGDSFECLCFFGYTGLYCENDTDECSSNPCVHGTCIDGISNYRCACDNGYGGTNCEYLDGAWSSWNDWGSCSVSCGYGMKTRTRTCTNPVPQRSGGHCLGHSLENTLCFPGSCTNGSWSDWQNWSNCSVDCGVGFRTRSRTCSNPQPSQLGTNCQGKSIDIGSCNKKDCDACQSHPCHYGNCRSNGDSFECLCFFGYTGLYCENDTDECSSNPCVHGTCIDGISNYRCACDNGYGGTNCEYLKRTTDCVDILRYTGNRTDGIYFVRTWRSHQVIKVYCDMTTDGGGWTVFQYRFDGTIDFYRSFSEYDAGFGNLTAEFWLGLSNIQEMAGQGQTDLRIDLEAANGTKAYETYDNFYLSPGPAYTLHLGPTIASLRISSTNRFGVYHNGADFSTYDHDVDTASRINCAVKWHGAWWYTNCYEANLNGQYVTPGTKSISGITYESFMGYISLKTSKMMMRRK